MKEAIKELAWSGEIRAEMLQVAINSRHQDALNRARAAAQQAADALRGDVTLELIVAEVQLLLHWRGGDHTQLRFAKVRTGQHRFVTDANTIELVRGLARLQPDGMIASILNRIGHRTAHEERWTARSVCSLRNRHAIAVFVAGEWRSRGELTLDEAATLLQVNPTTVIKWIRAGRLAATQLCPNAPWVLRQSDVQSFKTRLAQTPASHTANAAQLVLEIH